ncbi:MAG: PaaX family transcriptional regulator C-terminal domain-containing protein [Hyphomicrobiaceae bacterium]|nr:PaaX family transcriptional regulator C-terminal domain-containing protein [Hyphomicrobiaceae bacterium]
MASQAQRLAHTSPLERLLERFERQRPLRAGSLIVTVFGDAIVPRGGTLWLGSLLEVMGLFGVEGGLVRTALSRLVQENWFERTRAGKNSFYRLSARGRAKFADATARIYHAGEPAWDGTLRLALLASLPPADRLAVRDRLALEGWGQTAPHVMLRPVAGGEALPSDIGDVIWLASRIEGNADAARRIGGSCWQLEPMAEAYARFIDTFGALGTRAGAGWDEAGAIRLRLLLIHEYRRIILRDPLLPRQMLPRDWPGFEARRLCRQLYRLTLVRSEAWLDAHARALDGPLPPPDDAFKARFGSS